MSAEGAQLAPARHIPELDVLSSLPEASALPVRRESDGADVIRMSAKVRSSRPLATSQSLIVLSQLPEASACRPARTRRS